MISSEVQLNFYLDLTVQTNLRCNLLPESKWKWTPFMDDYFDTEEYDALQQGVTIRFRRYFHDTEGPEQWMVKRVKDGFFELFYFKSKKEVEAKYQWNLVKFTTIVTYRQEIELENQCVLHLDQYGFLKFKNSKEVSLVGQEMRIGELKKQCSAAEEDQVKKELGTLLETFKLTKVVEARKIEQYFLYDKGKSFQEFLKDLKAQVKTFEEWRKVFASKELPDKARATKSFSEVFSKLSKTEEQSEMLDSLWTLLINEREGIQLSARKQFLDNCEKQPVVKKYLETKIAKVLDESTLPIELLRALQLLQKMKLFESGNHQNLRESVRKLQSSPFLAYKLQQITQELLTPIQH